MYSNNKMGNVPLKMFEAPARSYKLNFTSTIRTCVMLS